MLAFVGFFLYSCTEYRFLQVYETTPTGIDSRMSISDGKQTFDGNHCQVKYRFWAPKGSSDFEIYNKTDQIIYIELSESFFIRNGFAYDLFTDTEWAISSSIGTTSAISYSYETSDYYSKTIGASISGRLSAGVASNHPYGNTYYTNASIGGSAHTSKTKSNSVTFKSTNSNAVSRSSTNTVVTKEKQTIAIPPHCSKIIKSYAITDSRFLSCDLPSFPSDSASLHYTAQNSPLTFSIFITYRVGENAYKYTIKNDFYVSSITNYAEPYSSTFIKREKPCKNNQSPNEPTSKITLYDRQLKDGICEPAVSFYIPYETKTSKKLYKKKNNYVYNEIYDAYTTKVQ